MADDVGDRDLGVFGDDESLRTESEVATSSLTSSGRGTA
jgi:hypothetical protein